MLPCVGGNIPHHLLWPHICYKEIVPLLFEWNWKKWLKKYSFGIYCNQLCLRNLNVIYKMYTWHLFFTLIFHYSTLLYYYYYSKCQTAYIWWLKKDKKVFKIQFCPFLRIIWLNFLQYISNVNIQISYFSISILLF